MKKPSLKLDDKSTNIMTSDTKKSPENIYKYNNQLLSYGSAQNLRPVNLPKDSDSPSKNDAVNRNSRKP